MIAVRIMPRSAWTWIDCLIWSLTILLFILWPLCRANAQTTVKFEILPPGYDGQVQGVGRARYYPLKEYLELARFDSELVLRRIEADSFVQTENELRTQLNEKDIQIQSLEYDKDILRSRSLRLEESWKACETSLISASTPPIWPYIVAVTGVVVGIAAGVTIVVVVHK
jgi:hypothetical protein